MSVEDGTEGHAGPSDDKESLQMNLFGNEPTTGCDQQLSS